MDSFNNEYIFLLYYYIISITFSYRIDRYIILYKSDRYIILRYIILLYYFIILFQFNIFNKCTIALNIYYLKIYYILSIF